MANGRTIIKQETLSRQDEGGMGTICNTLSTRVSKVNKCKHRYLLMECAARIHLQMPADSVNSCHPDLMVCLGTTCLELVEDS